jgi:curved DNA-binding protein CbpA
MERIYTHYDNLKVARDAPPEVIRAAYKSLAHKYHPDRNQNNPGASRIMSLINIAYEELSDPVKRRLHDEWIREQEKLQRTHSPENVTANNKTEGSSIQRSTKNKRNVLLFLAAIIALVIIVDRNTDNERISSRVDSSPPSTQSVPYSPISSSQKIPYPQKKLASSQDNVASAKKIYKIYVKDWNTTISFPGDATKSEMESFLNENEHILNPDYKEKGSKLLNKFSDAGEKEILGIKDISPNKLSVKSPYVRSVTAPNGEMWPSTAAYVKGYKKLHADGLSSVTVDNTQNNSDVFVKLVSISENNALPVRQFFIPAAGRFTVNKVRSGNYDIRYRDLDSGTLAKSESFMLQQKTTSEGIQYSNITMTLYKVRDGNMRTYTISEADF